MYTKLAECPVAERRCVQYEYVASLLLWSSFPTCMDLCRTEVVPLLSNVQICIIVC